MLLYLGITGAVTLAAMWTEPCLGAPALGAPVGAFLGLWISILLISRDARGKGPRTLWGWALAGFWVPVIGFVAGGLFRAWT